MCELVGPRMLDLACVLRAWWRPVLQPLPLHGMRCRRHHAEVHSTGRPLSPDAHRGPVSRPVSQLPTGVRELFFDIGPIGRDEKILRLSIVPVCRLIRARGMSMQIR